MRLTLWILLVLASAVLLLVVASWLAEQGLARFSAAFIAGDARQLPPAEVGLVLGAAPIGPEGGANRYFEYRLDAAALLWRSGRVNFLLVSGNREGPDYDEPTAMRAGLLKRGVPAEAIYRDFAGVRTYDSLVRARDVFGQTRLIVVSQRFHLSRAIFLARQAGVEAWGLEARDVDRAYSLVTELRRYPSALRACWDAWVGTALHDGGTPIAIGRDPPT